MKKNELLRGIPKIDEVLQEQHLSALFEVKGRDVVVNAARSVIDGLRDRILSLADSEVGEFDRQQLNVDSVAKMTEQKLQEDDRNHLHKVINATGTILHTNLGRAPLCKEAVENVASVASGYSNLEYDVKAGKRGSRHDILNDLMKELTGAEDVMIVNNNASATMIVLSSMAAGKEVITSRGELVEIGGAFRIPDIMEQSGATLHEVGTTNKTRIKDYENAIVTAEDVEKAYEEDRKHGRYDTEHKETGALMKVHTSNYKVMGFTEEATLTELVDLGHKKGLPVIFDMGNGLMVNLKDYGLDEPNVPAALGTGIDVILFSGDKLLGGPQAGIIAGRKKYIEKMKKHPLARALRVDKMTFAAMEETLKKYRSTETALRDIPVLRMITESDSSMRMRAQKLAGAINAVNPELHLEIVDVDDQIGGGSAPMVFLPGYAIAVTSDKTTAQAMERQLRKPDVPVIARIHEDRLLLCARTFTDDEIPYIAEALRSVK